MGIASSLGLLIFPRNLHLLVATFSQLGLLNPDRLIINQASPTFYRWFVKRLRRVHTAFATCFATQANNPLKRSLIIRQNNRATAHAIDAFARWCISAAICWGARRRLGQNRHLMPDTRDRLSVTRFDALTRHGTLISQGSTLFSPHPPESKVIRVMRRVL